MPEKANIVDSLKNEARTIVEKGGTMAALFKGANFFMYKKEAQSPFKIAYICPGCGHKGRADVNLVVPYILKCANCSNLIFKQEKVPKKGMKKLAK